MFPKTVEITAIRSISWSIPLGGPAQGLPMSTTGNSETACRHHRFPWMEEKLVDLWPMLKLPLVKLCYSKKKNIRRRWVHCLRSSGASHSTVSFHGMGWHPIDVHFSSFFTLLKDGHWFTQQPPSVWTRTWKSPERRNSAAPGRNARRKGPANIAAPSVSERAGETAAFSSGEKAGFFGAKADGTEIFFFWKDAAWNTL